MKKFLLYILIPTVFITSISSVKAQKANTHDKIKKILYFNPEVEPDLEEIKEPTSHAFFSAVSDNVSAFRRNKMLRSEVQVSYDSIDSKTILEYSKNNDADFVIVPKVKYFKVGLGKYVFSNQVIVSMKLFDAEGNFIAASDYDTYRKNMRLLGSAENSIKIGTNGAMKSILKELRKQKPSSEAGF
ncbi:pyruvate decarboxylase [Chryseobacterium sp. 09-1422]|uniref:Pyruvate decarboxylase n=1 Tax=Chryseobacterium kimseyorum TaxID=2984028 RepID=A0ABT3I2Q2_9FLAO|nr:pyruvate decarboxylase [Chryseobacterium kimseyorum]MCW3170355.1 pyruvate decarboxylase [Chryseobacterium kimseyorum]